MRPALPQPDRNRFSTLIALLLLTYALIRIVVLPSIEAELSLFGLIITLKLSTPTLMLLMAAALAASGADWLLRSHPLAAGRNALPEHWILPGMAALGAGAVLVRLPGGPAFWVGFALSASVLISVLLAEFIVQDRGDPRREVSVLGLTALAYLLLIATTFTMRASGLRAIFSIPLITLATGAISWRLLYLNYAPAVSLRYAFLICAVTAQFAWALHYWPSPPLQVGLSLGLIAYLGNELSMLHLEGVETRGRLIETTFLAGVAVLAIVLFT